MIITYVLIFYMCASQCVPVNAVDFTTASEAAMTKEHWAVKASYDKIDFLAIREQANEKAKG